MNKSKVLVSFVLICYILFAIFEFSGYEKMSYYFHALIVPLITVLYVLFIKRKSKLFLMFLICYSLSDLLGVVIDLLPLDGSQELYDFQYYLGNSLYILAYIFLLFKINKSLDFKHVLKYYKMHLIVLIVLNIYLLYVIHDIINPNLVFESDYYLELTYNVVVLALLSLTLLNYFYRDNKKSLYLFLGALCIVFSEVMDIAYIYVVQRCILNFLSTTLALGAFYFFYQQSKLLNVAAEEENFVFVEE